VTYPELAKEIVKAGHVIGNHTLNHANIRTLPKNKLREEILNFNEIYNSLFGTNPNYFRPPHGRLSFGLAKLLNEYKLKNVMWSLLTYDYKNDINIVKFAVRNFLKSNSIVVLHDNDKCSEIIIDAIDMIAQHVETKGFTFGNPDKCLK
jgi:peptidoglycan/xylan/chitin deacetylase (PgdA/CDA1 family)